MKENNMKDKFVPVSIYNMWVLEPMRLPHDYREEGTPEGYVNVIKKGYIIK